MGIKSFLKGLFGTKAEPKPFEKTQDTGRPSKWFVKCCKTFCSRRVRARRADVKPINFVFAGRWQTIIPKLKAWCPEHYAQP